MTILLTKDLIAVAIIVLVTENIAAEDESAPFRGRSFQVTATSG